MKKLLFLILSVLIFPTIAMGAAPSRSFTYVSGSAIKPDEVTTNEDNIFNYLSSGVDTYTDGTIVNADISGSAAITYGKLSLGSSITSSDITDGTVVNADISASAAIVDTKLAQITTASKVHASSITGGLTLPSGAVFFMITGSCPSGSTDVTATYTDKFLRINATQGSTGGSDTVTLAEANLPSHTHGTGTLAAANESAHTHDMSDRAGALLYTTGSGSGAAGYTAATTPYNPGIRWATDAGSAHGHTLSGSTGAIGSGTAATITNPYVTCKMCQVN